MAGIRRSRTEDPISIGGTTGRARDIYRVAAEIMCQKGYDATSMNDIADAAGLTKAGIYHYIRGKEELLFEIMSYAMDVVEQGVMAPAREVEDPAERLGAIVERHAMRILEGTGAVTILLDEMTGLTPAHRRAIKARKRAYFDFIRDTLEQVAAGGKLRAANPTVAAFGLLGMVVWISRWYRRDGKLKPETIARDCREMALGAVLNR